MPVTAITLVCNPAAPVIDERLADAALTRLEGLGRTERRPLAAGIAEDFILAAKTSRADVEALLADPTAGAPVDIIVQPAAGRRKSLLIADMDSTIIGQECIDELADFAGLKSEIAAITERAMRGELPFEDALRARVGKLAGLSVAALEEAFRTRISLNPGARTLVETMNSRGATTVLVSGGFTFFVERVARLAGFQRFQANDLLIEGGRLTGEIGAPILGREAKAAALRREADATGLPLAASLAVGDGANDLDMIRAAGLGVAYRAKPVVAAAADASIRHGDLTALLFAQGIAARDFIL